MADDEIVEVIAIAPVVENLTVSPDVRVTLAINLIDEIVVTGAEENQHVLREGFKKKKVGHFQ